MILSDTIYLKDVGNLTLQFKDIGSFDIFKENLNVEAEFIIYIISMDCNLTSNVIYYHCKAGFNHWCFSSTISFLKNYFLNIHPGFKIEIFDKFAKNKIFEKNYHSSKKYKCIDLKSNKKYPNYDSYYTFFNDEFFLKNFTLRDSDIVYDLGANIGSFSIACSNYDINRIYAFEPDPESFGYLEENCKNYCSKAVCFKKAVSDDFKKVVFGGNSASSIGHSIISDSKSNLIIKNEVDCINLEKFVYYNNLDLPTYLKLDIEGSEYNFFENTSNEFFKNVHTIFFEFHENDGKKLKKIVDRFVNLNYRVVHNELFQDILNHKMNTLYLIK